MFSLVFFFVRFKLYLHYYYYYYYFCRFRLVSPRSYIVTLIPTLNKFHKQTQKSQMQCIDSLLGSGYWSWASGSIAGRI